jgi:hypothetical protein
MGVPDRDACGGVPRGGFVGGFSTASAQLPRAVQPGRRDLKPNPPCSEVSQRRSRIQLREQWADSGCKNMNTAIVAELHTTKPLADLNIRISADRKPQESRCASADLPNRFHFFFFFFPSLLSLEIRGRWDAQTLVLSSTSDT